MKTLKLSVLALSFLTPFCTFAANVYMTENSSFDVFGRVQALVMNGDGAYPDYPSPNASGDNSIIATTRFGIAGRTKLFHGLRRGQLIGAQIHSCGGGRGDHIRKDSPKRLYLRRSRFDA